LLLIYTSIYLLLSFPARLVTPKIYNKRRDTMTHIETARINEAIGIQIGIIQEKAQKLIASSELQLIEADIAALDAAIADLKDTLASIPHKHQ
jgi:hypothetical protein